MLLRIALVVLCLWSGNLLRLSFAGEPRASEGQSMSRRGNGRLVLDMPPLKFASPERLQHQTARLLSVASSVPEYHCMVYEECLNAMLPPHVDFDAQFRDILVDVPVYGQSHTQGKLQSKLVPDGEHASFELCFTGTIQMAAVGHTRGIQIDSDATTQFKAVKRMTLDNARLRCLPAECEARSRLRIERITNRRPRIMGGLVERVARRRVNSTMSQAEKECSEHVEQAVREHLDRYIESLAEVVNVGLRSHVRALSAEDHAAWTKIRFCTNEDCLFVMRGTSNPPAWEHTPGARSLVIAMPRTRFGQNAGIGWLLLDEQDGPRSTDAERQPVAFDAWPHMAFRPTVKWESEALTVSLEIDARDH
jgi:hypothetical protein